MLSNWTVYKMHLIDEILMIAEYNTYQIKRYLRLPYVSGIYLVSNPFPEIIYIGKAKNIAERWQNHNRRKQFKILKHGTVSIYQCSVKDLDCVEQYLIKTIQPVLNIQFREHKYSEDEAKQMLSVS